MSLKARCTKTLHALHEVAAHLTARTKRTKVVPFDPVVPGLCEACGGGLDAVESAVSTADTLLPGVQELPDESVSEFSWQSELSDYQEDDRLEEADSDAGARGSGADADPEASVDSFFLSEGSEDSEASGGIAPEPAEVGIQRWGLLAPPRMPVESPWPARESPLDGHWVLSSPVGDTSDWLLRLTIGGLDVVDGNGEECVLRRRPDGRLELFGGVLKMERRDVLSRIGKSGCVQVYMRGDA